MPIRSRSLLCIALCVLAGAPALAQQQAGQQQTPQPPCSGPPVPAYAPAGGAPTVAAWNASALRRAGWQPPACLGWSGSTHLAAALAGSFRFAGSIDDLLARFGDLAAYPSIKFWSIMNHGWRPLVTSAGVMESAPGGGVSAGGAATKPALTPADFAPGRDSYYFEESPHSNKAVYRMRTLDRSAGRFVVEAENATPIRAFGFTMFEPAALQYATFVEKGAGDDWRYYQIVRVADGASGLALSAEASYLNRLVALFRYMAGAPTDAGPPPAQ